MPTVTAIFFNLHVYKLQTTQVELSMCTQCYRPCGKFFHYSPKKAETLKEVQQVLDLPELKMIKPSDTRWLAHEQCVKSVKRSYSAIVLSLNNIYEEPHEPEALGLSNYGYVQTIDNHSYLHVTVHNKTHIVLTSIFN